MPFDFKSALPPQLLTPRLLLRPPLRADVAAIVALADNPRIARMLRRFPSPYTRADAVGFVENSARRSGKLAYALTLRRGTFVGIASYMFADGAAPEIGYWLGEPFWGQGLMSEAVAALVGAAGNCAGIDRLGAVALAHNFASLRVLEKSGFVRVAGRVAEAGAHKAKTVLHLERELR